MKNYMKLVNFELNRFSKLYYILMALIAVIQIAAVIVISLLSAKHYKQMLISSDLSNEYLDKFSLLNVINSGFYAVTITGGMIVILIYTFFIWYRDWVGKGAFAYRLLMLPTSRINLILSKLTTILVLTLGFVALQYVLVYIEHTIIQVIIPLEFRSSINVNQILESQEFSIFIPSSIGEFLIIYGLGIMISLVIFTGILLERSYGLKGALSGIGYGILSSIVFLSPFIIATIIKFDITYYANEAILAGTLSGLVVSIVSLVYSNYLLNYKVNV